MRSAGLWAIGLSACCIVVIAALLLWHGVPQTPDDRTPEDDVAPLENESSREDLSRPQSLPLLERSSEIKGSERRTEISREAKAGDASTREVVTPTQRSRGDDSGLEPWDDGYRKALRILAARTDAEELLEIAGGDPESVADQDVLALVAQHLDEIEAAAKALEKVKSEVAKAVANEPLKPSVDDTERPGDIVMAVVGSGQNTKVRLSWGEDERLDQARLRLRSAVVSMIDALR